MQKESDNFIDNSIITISVAFIVGSIGVYTTLTPTLIQLRYLLVPAILSLTISLFGSLWHRIRNPKRELIFNQSSENLEESIRSEMKSFAKEVLAPSTFLEIKTLYDSGKISDKDKLKDISADMLKDKFIKIDPFFQRYYKGYSSESEKLYQEAFDLPLDESFSRLKWIFDVLSRKYRIFVFIIGIITFVSSIIIRII